MDNQLIRAHLRQGEQAVKTLQALGYTYERGHWVAPADPHDPLLAALKELVEAEVVKRTPPPVDTNLKAGDEFVINRIPVTANALAAQPWEGRIFKAREVEISRERGIEIVRFGFNFGNRGFWIPTSHVTKVTRHADF